MLAGQNNGDITDPRVKTQKNDPGKGTYQDLMNQVDQILESESTQLKKPGFPKKLVYFLGGMALGLILIMVGIWISGLFK